jgi:hypothetical protein
MEEIDLFENYKILPIEVQKILSEYDDMTRTYIELWKLVNDLEKWVTCDYYLDAIPQP